MNRLYQQPDLYSKRNETFLNDAGDYDLDELFAWIGNMPNR
jgi:hypothetical protein